MPTEKHVPDKTYFNPLLEVDFTLSSYTISAARQRSEANSNLSCKLLLLSMAL